MFIICNIIIFNLSMICLIVLTSLKQGIIIVNFIIVLTSLYIILSCIELKF